MAYRETIGYSNSYDGAEMTQVSNPTADDQLPRSNNRSDTGTIVTNVEITNRPTHQPESDDYSDDGEDHQDGQANNRNGSKTKKQPEHVGARRPRSILLFVAILICLIFSIASLPVTVLSYTGAANKKVKIEVGYWSISVCPADQVRGGCELVSNSNYLCDRVTTDLSAAGAFGIIALIIEVFLLVTLFMEFVGIIIARTLTFRVSWILWFVLLIQWAIVSDVFLAKKCKDTSFSQMKFKYKAGWVLPFFLWLTLPMVLISMVVFKQRLQKSMAPARYESARR